MATSSTTGDWAETGFNGTVSGGEAHHDPGRAWVRPVRATECPDAEAVEALFVGRLERPEAGHLLMPHVISRLLHLSRLRCASFASADFTGAGGHAVRNYGESALELGEDCAALVHVGGDVLTAGLAEAYPEAIDEDEADRFASLLQLASTEQIDEYIRRRTGQLDDFAYVLAPEGRLSAAGLCFHAVGLPRPGDLAPSRRRRLVELMKKADFVGVRDRTGAEFLEAQGVRVERMPCGLVVLPQVCARPLRKHREAGSISGLRDRFRRGWIAVEVAGGMSEQRERAAEALAAVARAEDCGIVLFDGACRGETGADADLAEWASLLPADRTAVVRPESIWEIALLVIEARLLCAASVEMRSLALSSAVPRVAFPTTEGDMGSYCELWEHFDVKTFLGEENDWSGEIAAALAFDPERLRQHASRLHDRYFASFRLMCRETGMRPRLLPGPREGRTGAISPTMTEWLGAGEAGGLLDRLQRHCGGEAVRDRLRRIFHTADAPEAQDVSPTETLPG